MQRPGPILNVTQDPSTHSEFPRCLLQARNPGAMEVAVARTKVLASKPYMLWWFE